MRDVWDVGCSGYGMFRMQDVWDVGCSGYGMWEVGRLPGCGILIYKMPQHDIIYQVKCSVENFLGEYIAESAKWVMERVKYHFGKDIK